ncbi:TRAP-type C4-dicarboxylate transport system, substrate-binding protein [Thalassovita litoralis]|jgi:TRAP-type C4-dicarboxylate transport system substrate-binding protein|uniref:TRAP-type C4-dicarboxylate transport system, substrate-binding protein n=1 Tax=Thalassovita litoralis TaxID=1010611 RepID=A0A521ENN3_9RHOB|nr:C4-dicarboxylate TRAP transporter substrate-binding protein [Thalassovita litoralis]SMO85523.1 TRAP-type C4-dicarboxylate transport system, substrate-binding protein [Thalassovita litoralis]
MNVFMKSAVTGLAMLAMSAAAASAQMVLRYNEPGPNRGTRAQALEYYAQQVEELSGGEMKFDIHWGGALLKWKGALEGIGAGTADMGTLLAPYAPNQLKATSIADLPAGEAADPWIGMRAMYELQTTNPQVQESLAAQNLVYLSNFHTTGLQLECTKGHKIEKLEDVKGVKMRAGGIYTNVFAEAGASMVSMTYDKVYQAYDSGLIQCEAGYFYTIRAYKLYELIDNVTRADYGQIGGFPIVINKDLWEMMKPEQQAILREAGSKMIDEFARLQIEEIDQVVSDLTSGAYGRVIPVTNIDPEAKKELIAAAQPFVEKWVSEFTADGFDGQGIWAEWNGLLDKYTKTRDGEGYPWAR